MCTSLHNGLTACFHMWVFIIMSGGLWSRRDDKWYFSGREALEIYSLEKVYFYAWDLEKLSPCFYCASRIIRFIKLLQMRLFYLYYCSLVTPGKQYDCVRMGVIWVSDWEHHALLLKVAMRQITFLKVDQVEWNFIMHIFNLCKIKYIYSGDIQRKK